jgi:hypothetical protein
MNLDNLSATERGSNTPSPRLAGRGRVSFAHVRAWVNPLVWPPMSLNELFGIVEIFYLAEASSTSDSQESVPQPPFS